MRRIDCRAVDAFNLWRVEGVKFVLVAGLLGQDALGALQHRGERGFQHRVPGDLAADIADQPAEPGAHASQPAQALLVAPAMQQTGNLAPRPGRQTQEGLAQFDTVALRQTIQPFDRPQDQMAVGRVRHRLGLNRGVDRDPFQLPFIHSLCLDGHGDGFGKQRLQVIGPDPLAPAGHRGAVNRQPVLEVRLAAEGLKVWVLQPGRTGLLVGETLHVLEQMQSGHEACRRPTPAFPIMAMRPKRVIKAGPVDQARQLQKFVPRIENAFERTSEQIVGPGFGQFRAHLNLAGGCGLHALQHEDAAMGIPYAQASGKSQGFGGFRPKTLRFLILSEPEYESLGRYLRENHRGLDSGLPITSPRWLPRKQGIRPARLWEPLSAIQIERAAL